MSIFGICFILYFFKLSTCRGFRNCNPCSELENEVAGWGTVASVADLA